MHEAKLKGDIACSFVIYDLTRLGFSVFVPVVTEHCAFDLISYKDNQTFRIQCKYSCENLVSNITSWTDKNGTHKRTYGINDFDFYALCIPNLDSVLYVPISLGGITIQTEIPDATSEFWWWQDFLEFGKADQFKRSYYEFKDAPSPSVLLNLKRTSERKVEWPNKETLQLLVEEQPIVSIAKIYGVSDKAVHKWIEKLGVIKPNKKDMLS